MAKIGLAVVRPFIRFARDVFEEARPGLVDQTAKGLVDSAAPAVKVAFATLIATMVNVPAGVAFYASAEHKRIGNILKALKAWFDLNNGNPPGGS